MQNNDPVFRDASHALHVSFMIHSMPAGSRSPTAIVIDHLVKENHVWDGLPEPTRSGVNFVGLTPQEVRGQCAQVIAMVNHLPHHAESDACKAIYGQQVIKADGVRGMARYCGPAIGCSNDMAMYVAWHVFMRPKQREGVTLGDIGLQFGVTTAAVRNAAAIVRRYGQVLHMRAVDALTERFLAGGLIADAETA